MLFPDCCSDVPELQRGPDHERESKPIHSELTVMRPPELLEADDLRLEPVRGTVRSYEEAPHARVACARVDAVLSWADARNVRSEQAIGSLGAIRVASEDAPHGRGPVFRLNQSAFTAADLPAASP